MPSCRIEDRRLWLFISVSLTGCQESLVISSRIAPKLFQ